MSAAPLLEAHGLEKWFGPLPAVRDVSFRLDPGDVLVVFGPNGAGKSTLLRLLAGVVRPAAGAVAIHGQPVRAGAPAASRHLGFLSHRTHLYSGLTARENLTLHARLRALPEPRERSDRGLRGVGMAERGAEPVRDLSRGMQQRVALARTLLHEPDVLLLDEPFTGLDVDASAALNAAIDTTRGGGGGVVLVTHDLERGLELATHVAIQVAGRWVWQGRADEVEARGWRERYTGLVAVGR